MEIIYKVPQESSDYKSHSDFVIAQISAIMRRSIESGRNRIFINTNLKRGLPLENINKVAGPFVEAWALEQFENIADEVGNQYELVHVEPGKRLDPFDIILQFRRKNKTTDYISECRRESHCGRHCQLWEKPQHNFLCSYPLSVHRRP